MGDMVHIALAAGGTGGHMMPAEAAGRILLSRGHKVEFITDERGDAYPDILTDVPRTVLKSGRKSGAGIVGKIRLAVNMAGSTVKCWRQYGKDKPDVVVGFGGYPSIPAMLAARFRNLPTVLHEQNAVFGRSNRFLSAGSDKIALSFPGTSRLSDKDKAKSVMTGNPVRGTVSSIGTHGYSNPSHDGEIRILIVGGSQGATILSAVVPEALAAMSADRRAHVNVVHQGRDSDLGAVRDVYSGAGIKANVSSYFTDMDVHLSWAHIVVARAGASTVSELAAAARPSILVPLPSAMDDHQTSNAQYLAEVGGAILLTEKEFTVQRLTSMLDDILNNDNTLEKMSVGAHSAAMLGAAEKLADVILEATGKDK